MIELLPKCSDSKGKCPGVMILNKKEKEKKETVTTCTLCACHIDDDFYMCSLYTHSIVC